MSQIVEIKVPDIGGHENVDVIAVEVKVGDSIALEDTLITLETDKATMDVPADAAGVVKEVKVKVGDKEVKESRIKNLKPNEIGYLRISNFKQDGAVATAKEVGTILEVTLAKPILPNSKTTFTLDFDGQVPVQVRRSGRNNAEGVALSMSQW